MNLFTGELYYYLNLASTLLYYFQTIHSTYMYIHLFNHHKILHYSQTITEIFGSL